MQVNQIIFLILLGIFYIAYFTKMWMLKRHGITGNLLGKGDKPKGAIITELFLRLATLAGGFVQFLSVLFPAYMGPGNASMPMVVIGILLALVGNVFFIIALLYMKDNWRAGFDHKQKTHLVTNGIYRFSRNPAFVGFDLLYIGCALAFPNIFNIISAILAVILFHMQIMGEEKYLEDTFGKAYFLYKKQTRRYI